jgi:hypothetical protein
VGGCFEIMVCLSCSHHEGKKPWNCPTYSTFHQQLSTWLWYLLLQLTDPGSLGTRKIPQLKAAYQDDVSEEGNAVSIETLAQLLAP